MSLTLNFLTSEPPKNKFLNSGLLFHPTFSFPQPKTQIRTFARLLTNGIANPKSRDPYSKIRAGIFSVKCAKFFSYAKIIPSSLSLIKRPNKKRHIAIISIAVEAKAIEAMKKSLQETIKELITGSAQEKKQATGVLKSIAKGQINHRADTDTKETIISPNPDTIAAKRTFVTKE